MVECASIRGLVWSRRKLTKIAYLRLRFVCLFDLSLNKGVQNVDDPIL